MTKQYQSDILCINNYLYITDFIRNANNRSCFITKYSDAEYEIRYSGSDGTVIYYMQSGGVDSTEVGIDYEEADYQKIVVNG